ncbi:MAG: hypothetical protein PHI83_06755 [Sphaerochaetaceae bacterium]|jgi:hypothetical protein|nr:hypothetical protein [Sphaerochaetaceae bacterium]
MTIEQAREALLRQLFTDYSFDAGILADKRIHFTDLHEDPGRRKYLANMDVLCLAIDGTAIVCAKKEARSVLEPLLKGRSAQWLFEAPRIIEISEALSSLDIDSRDLDLHLYYSFDGQRETFLPSGYQTRWIEMGQFEEFRGTELAQEALSFSELNPDFLALGAMDGDRTIALAGASLDGANVCQIGINVLEGYEGRHIASALVSMLARKLLEKGLAPFYGTAISHISSQRVAYNAGFHPAWASLHARHLEG